MLRGWLSSDAFDRLLVRAPRLSWVHSATSGVERALTPAALERGVVVTNARGVFSRPIAEYVLMMILAVSRRLPQLLELQRERTWQPLEGARAARRHGRDRRARARSAGRSARSPTAFGCRVVAVRRRAGRRGGDRVEAEDGERPPARRDRCSIASAARRRCPSCSPSRTSSSSPRRSRPRPRSMINAETLADGQAGRVADQRRPRPPHRRAGAPPRAARRPLGGAVLDTFRDEPLPPMSPFYDLPNVIVTPHTAWSSGRVLDRSVELFCDNLRRFAAASRCSTSSTRPPGTDVARADTHLGARCRSPSSGLPERARRPSSTR